MAQCYAKIINPDAGYADWPQGTFRYWLYTDSLSQNQAEAQFRGYGFPQMIAQTTTTVPAAPAGTTWSVRGGGTTPPVPVTGFPGTSKNYRQVSNGTTKVVAIPSSNPGFLDIEIYDIQGNTYRIRNKSADSNDGQGKYVVNQEFVAGTLADIRLRRGTLYQVIRLLPIGPKPRPDNLSFYDDPVINAIEMFVLP